MEKSLGMRNDGIHPTRDATKHVKLIEVGDGVLADYLPQMIWIVDAVDRRLIYANPSFVRYFGAAAETRDERSAHFHQDDLAILEDLFETARAPEREVRIKGLEETYRWHSLMLVPVVHDERIVEWIFTALDIDTIVLAREKHREATDLFTLAQEAAGAGTWDLDLRTGGVRLSRESARLHGIGDDDVEMDLARWKTIVVAEDAAAVLATLQHAVDTGTTYSGEFRIRAADGGLRWLSGIGRAYYDAFGNPVRMIGLNFDVTDRKTTEAKLDMARQEAERASTSKSDFLANMSHEIRTPLNSIIGYTDLLLEETERGSAVRRKLEVIQESGAALLTVLNDILDFSKIEAGQIDLAPIAFSPRALVDNIMSMLTGLAQRKGVDFARCVADDVPAHVLADEARIRQILLNLVNNAIKFTDHGYVRVGLVREGETERGERLCFSVEDSGMGIPLEQQDRLFQRFSQVDGSINRRFGGTGLGLAISKQLVDLMGGEIGFESRSGEGSTFRFRLDLPRADPEGAASPSMRTGTQGPTPGVRILLVEDIAVNQDLAKAVLERAGHNVDIVANGAEAMEAVRLKAYDVVLMDVQMPVMDGMTATRAIRASEHGSRTIPIVAMTANVLPDQIAELKSAGMDDHVGKPFKRAELLDVVARWTAQPSEGAPLDVRDGFDRRAFDALEEIIGTAALRVCCAKYSDELATRFGAASTGDAATLHHDAHTMINAAGLLGFQRLLAILRQIVASPQSEGLPDIVFDLERERLEVLADLDRYLKG